MNTALKVMIYSLMIISLVIPGLINDIDGSELEVKTLKDNKIEIGKIINTINHDISIQHKIISDLKNEIVLQKENLIGYEKINDNTWDSIGLIYDTKISIEENQNKLFNENKLLQSIRHEKLINIKKQSALRTEIKNMEKNDIEVLEILLISLSQQEQKDIGPVIDITGLRKNIGIKLSNTCIQMIKNNITSTCPTYEELEILDTSLKRISGEFGIKDNMYQRIENSMIKTWNFYNQYDNELRLFIDPPSNLHDRIGIITISPNIDVYLSPQGNYKMGNYTVTQYHDRYIEECYNATINSNIWESLLPDTITYLRNNCDEKFTTFNNTKYITLPQTEYNILDSPSWHELQWFEESKTLCKNLCKEY